MKQSMGFFADILAIFLAATKYFYMSVSIG